jgi:hypothetical protein
MSIDRKPFSTKPKFDSLPDKARQEFTFDHAVDLCEIGLLAALLESSSGEVDFSEVTDFLNKAMPGKRRWEWFPAMSNAFAESVDRLLSEGVIREEQTPHCWSLLFERQQAEHRWAIGLLRFCKRSRDAASQTNQHGGQA